MKVRSWSRNWPKLHKKSEFWSSFGVSFPPAAENRRSLISRGVGIAGFRPHPRGIEWSIKRHVVSTLKFIFTFTCFYLEKWVGEGWWNWIRYWSNLLQILRSFLFFEIYICPVCNATRSNRGTTIRNIRACVFTQFCKWPSQTIQIRSWKKMVGGAFKKLTDRLDTGAGTSFFGRCWRPPIVSWSGYYRPRRPYGTVPTSPSHSLGPLFCCRRCRWSGPCKATEWSSQAWRGWTCSWYIKVNTSMSKIREEVIIGTCFSL